MPTRSPLRFALLPALAGTVLAALACGPLPGQQSTDDLAARLDLLCEELDARRQQLHIAGMALSIVRGDEVLLARGFGWRDVERQLPATEDTVFAIGSTTKTFTAVLLGMLAEAGKLDFDEPVSTYLPGFALADPRNGHKVTLRDLLSHRTGLSRMPMVWCAGVADRDAALDCVQRAELLKPFRGDFNYSNMNFVVAGEVAARVAGTTWEALLADRLLEPLGMATASPSVEALLDPERASRGYLWNEREHAFEVVDPVFDLRTVAPAGAINASVVDMSKYLRMLLAGGIADGGRLVQKDTLEALWEKEILLDPPRFYGLGWMISGWNDHRMVDHGGNIDGFCSVFALLPDEGLGFSLLMNVKVSPLQNEAPKLVWEALLGDLRQPPRMAEADLEPYVGSFRSADTRLRVDTRIRGGRLQVRVEREPWRELQWPDESGRWIRTNRATVSLDFTRSEGGSIEALTLQRRRRSDTLQRVAAGDDPAQPVTPEVRELLDRMRVAVGADAARDLTYRLEGTIALPQQGLTGRATFIGCGPERYALRTDFGDFGYQDILFDGSSPRVDSSMSTNAAIGEGRLEVMAEEHAIYFVDWPDLFVGIERQRRRTIGGRATEVLRVTPHERPPFTVYVDAETARMVRMKFDVPVEILGMHVPFALELGDYRQVGPVWLPFRRVTSNPILGEEVVQYERAAVGIEVSDATFARRGR